MKSAHAFPPPCVSLQGGQNRGQANHIPTITGSTMLTIIHQTLIKCLLRQALLKAIGIHQKTKPADPHSYETYLLTGEDG